MDRDIMNQHWKMFAIALVAICVILSCGCIGEKADKIGDITSTPSEYEGETVKIKGTVRDTFSIPLISQGAYKMSDNTGSIWVITTRGVPSEGEKISVDGTVRTAFKLGGQSFGTVVTEGSRESSWLNI